jgi:dihydrofolate synthase/folylpolyglutamate synthase
MTCEQALAYLAGLNESRIKPGLERIGQALRSLDAPHLKFPHLLIGGTNGKGSVASFLASALGKAGYHTGLYTSPHLQNFEERILVDGKSVTQEDLCLLVNAVKSTGIDMTFFEFATVMALLFFERQCVDVGVLEVGLGGKWDATNATDPLLSVITNVGIDHREWLGESHAEIALEKSGIMRSGRPVVLGPMPEVPRDILLKKAEETGARAVLYGRDYSAQRQGDGNSLHYVGMRWNIRGLAPGPGGQFQTGNAACALAALELLNGSGFRIDKKDAISGIELARWPGRFQLLEGSPPFIVDSAHNPAAVRALVQSLDRREGVVWLFSALSGKDVSEMARELSRLANRFVIVPLDHPKGRTVRDLEGHMPEGADIKSVSTVKDGVVLARKMAGERGCVVVAGSVVLAGEVLKELGVMVTGSGIRNPESRSRV